MTKVVRKREGERKEFTGVEVMRVLFAVVRKSVTWGTLLLFVDCLEATMAGERAYGGFAPNTSRVVQSSEQDVGGRGV